MALSLVINVVLLALNVDAIVRAKSFLVIRIFAGTVAVASVIVSLSEFIVVSGFQLKDNDALIQLGIVTAILNLIFLVLQWLPSKPKM